MANLLDLPTELLDMVLAPCSLSTVSKLSRTNMSLHALLSPRVYSSIDWFWADDMDPPPIHLLLRTLLRNPSRAHHIKFLRLRGGSIPSDDVCFDWWRGYWHDWDLWRAPSISFGSCFSTTDIEQVRRLVYGVYRPSQSTWISQLQQGNVDVLVALLLCRLDSLERLDLGFSYLHRSRFVPAILRQGTVDCSKICLFPKLQSANIALDAPINAPSCWGDIDLLRPFFFLPSIHTVVTTAPEPVIFAWMGKTPSTLSLKNLVLLNSLVLENTLKDLLSVTPALEHLTYGHWRYADLNYPSRANANQLRCWRLNNALVNIQNTLQSLVVKVAFQYYEGVGFPDDSNFHGPIGVAGRLTVLKGMQKLTHLEIPWVVLFGWHAEVPVSWTNSLPDSLQDICLRNDLRRLIGYEWTDEMTSTLVAEFLDSCPQYFSSLSIVSFAYECEFGGKHGVWRDENAEHLRSLCRSKNIECMIKREQHWTEKNSMAIGM